MGFGDFLASIGSAVSSGIGGFLGGAAELAQQAVPFFEATAPIIGGLFGGGTQDPRLGGQDPRFTPGIVPQQQLSAGLPQFGGGGSIVPARAFPTVGDFAFPAVAGGGQMAIGGLLPALGRIGGSLVRAAPAIGGGALLGEVIERSLTPGGGGAMPANIGAPFRPTMAGARAQLFVVANPVTGTPTWFKPAGRPILFSGDLTACKRVQKIARRARRGR